MKMKSKFDKFKYIYNSFFFLKKLNKRWRPVLTAEDIIVSVISMLMDPNTESPANVDASVIFILFNKLIFFFYINYYYYFFFYIIF
jgi:ubiquitin-protein ligase